MTASPNGQPLSTMLRQWQEERPDLDLTALRLVGATMQLAQILESEFRQLGQSRFGIGSGDLRILMALRRAGPPYALRPTDLFSSLLVTSGAVTKQIERLAEAGFVERVLPRGALRRRVIALTPKGARAAEEALEAISTSLAGVAPSLAAMRKADVALLLDRLEALVDAASARTDRSAPEKPLTTKRKEWR